jgi:hypothetical protein
MKTEIILLHRPHRRDITLGNRIGSLTDEIKRCGDAKLPENNAVRSALKRTFNLSQCIYAFDSAYNRSIVLSLDIAFFFALR